LEGTRRIPERDDAEHLAEARRDLSRSFLVQRQRGIALHQAQRPADLRGGNRAHDIRQIQRSAQHFGGHVSERSASSSW